MKIFDRHLTHACLLLSYSTGKDIKERFPASGNITEMTEVVSTSCIIN